MENMNDSIESNSANSERKGTLPPVPPIPVSKEYDAGNNRPQAPKKRTGLYVIIVILILIILGFVGAGTYYYMQHQKGDLEEVAYKDLETSHDTADYAKFLQDYPNSKYFNDVKTRMNKLEEIEKAWGAIQNDTIAADFINFKNEYNDDYYNKLCDRKIDSLDFVAAQQAGTSEAFMAYMNRHPRGLYYSEAATAQSLAQDMQVSDDERSSVIGAVSGFYHAFEDNNPDGISNYIPPVMEQFLNKTNVNKAQVMDIISGMFNDHILGCSFVINNDFNIKKEKKNDQIVYNVTFSVDQHIRRDNPGKVFGSYNVMAQLNSYFQITILTMTQISEKKQGETMEEESEESSDTE